MENLSLTSAKSFIGKNVNLHLKDGSVIINVHLASIQKDGFRKSVFIEYSPYQNCRLNRIPLRSIAYAELVNLSLMKTAG